MPSFDYIAFNFTDFKKYYYICSSGAQKGFVNTNNILTVFRLRCLVEKFHIPLRVLAQWDKARVAPTTVKSACVFQCKCELWQWWPGVAGQCCLYVAIYRHESLEMYIHKQTLTWFVFPASYRTSLAEMVWGFNFKPAPCFIRMSKVVVTSHFFLNVLWKRNDEKLVSWGVLVSGDGQALYQGMLEVRWPRHLVCYRFGQLDDFSKTCHLSTSVKCLK